MKETFSESLYRKARSVVMLTHKGIFNKGNQKEYAAYSCISQENSPLKGKRICFLGSSVTYGFASRGESFVDYLRIQDDITVHKEAVNGTTLADKNGFSYVSRMRKIDPAARFDLFVCQLSTNDSSFGIPLGRVSESESPDCFDIKTTIGAMEYIIAYIKDTWKCPVAFYTCPRYPSADYQRLVEVLYQLQKKWKFEIIDLWQEEKASEAICRNRDIYMTDDIHPTRACYKKIWTPFFRKRLKEILLTGN